MTNVDSVNVIPGSDVGDVHQTFSSYTMVVTTPRMFPTRINVNSVIASGKNFFPTFQSIVSLTIPLTKSRSHSITFWAPVGFICNFLAPKTDKIKTIADVTMIMSTLAKLTDNQGMPNMFSITRDP